MHNQGILLPLSVFLMLGAGSLLLFCIARTLFEDLYSPRSMLKTNRPPAIQAGFFRWIPVVYSASEKCILDDCGLDAVMLLRFLKLGATLFTTLTLICLFILGPINYMAAPVLLDNLSAFAYEEAILSALSVDNVPYRSSILKFHLAFTWIVSIITLMALSVFFRDFVSIKLQYYKIHHSKIENRSIIVFGIPLQLRDEYKLASYFTNLGVGKVQSVVLVRNWSKLQEAVQKRGKYLLLLESVFANSHRNRYKLCANGSKYSRGDYLTLQANDQESSLLHSHPQSILVDELLFRLDSAIDPHDRHSHCIGFAGLFGERVDSAMHYARLFQNWDKEVQILRRQSEISAATAIGIVTFESASSAEIASQIVLNSMPFSLMSRMAPEPRDMYWQNLCGLTAHSYSKFFRSVGVFVSMFMLVFSSTFIVSTISGLIDLKQLAVLIPVFGDFLKNLPDSQVQFIQGVIPAVLLAGWTSILPNLLQVFAIAQGLEAISWIENSLLAK